MALPINDAISEILCDGGKWRVFLLMNDGMMNIWILAIGRRRILLM
jgi:hypothetical protein